MISQNLTLSVLLALSVHAGTATAVDAQTPGEYEIKAAFLYNFARFVTWPDESGNDGSGEGQSLDLCVLGEDPFGPALDDYEGKRLGTRTMRVRRSLSVVELTSCHIIFVARSEQSRFAEVLAAVEGRPVLTVADAEGFIELGGAINFIIRNNKLRFTINGEAAAACGLEVSSKLLRLGVH